MNNIFNKKFIGFNLIELMIVLAVLAIITTIAITQYNAYLKKVAISTATSLTDNIKARVMLYYADQEQFPSITNGNATEINNNFNRNALDANTQQNISNVAFYSFSDAATTPALPISVSSHFNSNYNVLGYIQVDFDPSRKLYIDSSAAAQLFLVAFEVNNKLSLNQFDEYLYNNTPKLVLASDQELGSTVQWQPFQTNLSVSIPGATQSCPGNQIMRSNRCSLCNAGTYTDINNAICVPCATGEYAATPGATQCTACDTGRYSSATGSISCTSCGTGVATCNSSNGGAIDLYCSRISCFLYTTRISRTSWYYLSCKLLW